MGLRFPRHTDRLVVNYEGISLSLFPNVIKKHTATELPIRPVQNTLWQSTEQPHKTKIQILKLSQNCVDSVSRCPAISTAVTTLTHLSRSLAVADIEQRRRIRRAEAARPLRSNRVAVHDLTQVCHVVKVYFVIAPARGCSKIKTQYVIYSRHSARNAHRLEVATILRDLQCALQGTKG